MKKLFRNDYSELAHPRIINALAKYSNEQNIAYGLDYHSNNAAKYIKNVFGAQNSDVHFLSGGTQTNIVMISYMLKHFEGVISPDTGHINVHEAAAIEGNGYKIITVKNQNGKLNAQQIIDVLQLYEDEHMVKPKVVYISDSTEIGTIYKRQELIDIYQTCKKNDLYLYIDGARIGSALTSKENDIQINELGRLCDAFYVGGTKNGLLFGEALVINNPKLKNDFRRHIKNKGAMLAKGYAVGIEFEEAFKDNLYFEVAKSTNDVADYLRAGLKSLNIEIIDSSTNQIFAIVNKKAAELYIEEFGCELWSIENDKYIIRFVTSFSTFKDDVDYLLDFIRKNHSTNND